ncbi:MAG: RHS repeat-associated core domain-containing protein, partial [Clostridia bacterium]|nr:RHS repeat-associated core domain-containing protein [Clostridia bacterium]
GNRTVLEGILLLGNIGQEYSFNYDTLDQLKEYNIDNKTYQYKYNTDGLRVEKITPEGTTKYYYGLNGNTIAEANKNGAVTAQIIWGHKPLARKVSGKYYYYLYNGHGDVVQIIDENGNTVNSYEYDEWGKILEECQDPKLGIDNPIRYAGEYYDEESGLYYLRARYYDPVVGRFITKDSYEGDIANPLSLNQYTYCHNDPVNYIDPSGHWGDLVHGDATRWIFNEMGLNSYHAEIVAEADVDTDEGSTGPMPWQDQSWHFDRDSSDVDSRQAHADKMLNDAIYNWNWANEAYANGEITLEQRHEWRVNTLQLLGKGLHALQDIDAHMDIGTNDYEGSIWSVHNFEPSIDNPDPDSGDIDNPRYDAASTGAIGKYTRVDSGSTFGSQRYKNTVARSKDYLRKFYLQVDIE